MKSIIGSKTGSEEQLSLFEIDEKKVTQLANTSAFSDPAFAGNKTQPIHRWVPWIAGFSSDFVRNALKEYLHDKGTVLDPFAGVGTTLVEAILAGHDAVGFEINPYPALASRTKLHAYLVDTHTLQSEILKLQRFYDDKIFSQYTPRNSSPAGFQNKI